MNFAGNNEGVSPHQSSSFITFSNFCSEACTCKPAMEKESHQFWHPCGVKRHTNWIYKLLRRLTYKWKFPGAILHSGLVFSPSTTSPRLLRGLYTVSFPVTHRDTSNGHRQLTQLLSPQVDKACGLSQWLSGTDRFLYAVHGVRTFSHPCTTQLNLLALLFTNFCKLQLIHSLVKGAAFFPLKH